MLSGLWRGKNVRTAASPRFPRFKHDTIEIVPHRQLRPSPSARDRLKISKLGWHQEHQEFRFQDALPMRGSSALHHLPGAIGRWPMRRSDQDRRWGACSRTKEGSCHRPSTLACSLGDLRWHHLSQSEGPAQALAAERRRLGEPHLSSGAPSGGRTRIERLAVNLRASGTCRELRCPSDSRYRRAGRNRAKP